MADFVTRITATIEGVGTSAQQPVAKLVQGGQRDESSVTLRGLAEIRHVRDALTRIVQAAEKLGPDAETTEAYYRK